MNYHTLGKVDGFQSVGTFFTDLLRWGLIRLGSVWFGSSRRTNKVASHDLSAALV